MKTTTKTHTTINVLGQHFGDNYALYHGDCTEVLRGLPDGGIDFTIHSPPFSGLYLYSDSERDAGNSADDIEFFKHYEFVVRELYRVTRPGRLAAVHCKQLVNYKGRDGMAGMRDFRGEIIRTYTAAGWAYHSEVCIWTDPVFEMQRTKSHGLLYKQLRADSTFSRQGLPEYLCIFRKWPKSEIEDAQIAPVTHTTDDFPLDLWQRYASPVWFDIPRTAVLNVEMARDSADERHICPLQLPVIERALDLWSNPGDVVLDPFNGISSSGVVSLKKKRRYIGIELKDSYVKASLKFLKDAERVAGAPSLWDGMDTPDAVEATEMALEVGA